MAKIKKITTTLKLTPEQLHDLQHEDGIWEKTSRNEDGEWEDDWYENKGEKLYEVIETEDVYVDLEKSYKEIQYTIQDTKTKLYFQGKLTYSVHWDDDGVGQMWKELSKVVKTITVIKYE